MNASRGSRRIARDEKRGGANLKFLIVVALIAIVVYVGYQFVPVVYQLSVYKKMMQDVVDKAAVTGQSPDWAKEQLKANAQEYGVPPEAITSNQINGRVEARVKFTRPINLPGYTYQYDFDYTARSTELFTPK